MHTDRWERVDSRLQMGAPVADVRSEAEQAAALRLHAQLSRPGIGSIGSGAFGDGLIIKRREPTTHDVHDPVTSVEPKIGRVGYLGGRQNLAVTQALRFGAVKETQDRVVGLGPSGTNRSLSLVARTCPW